MIETLKIVGLSIVAAVLYGVVHDMVTAHLSVEYFTIAHPPLIPSEEPIVLALGWGVVATWWMSLILGVLLACSGRLGSWPKRDWRQVLPLVVRLITVSAGGALFAGSMGMIIAANGQPPIGYWEDVIAPDRQIRFAGALFAHSASYIIGGVGGILVCVLTLRQRANAAAHSSSSMSQ